MTTLTRIGNSQGIRIPKAVIELAQLENKELSFKVTDEGLLIQTVDKPRQNWKEQFDKAIQPEGKIIDNDWLDAPLGNNKDWEW